MALKIKLHEGKRIPSELMDMLTRMAGHRDFCETCKSAMASGSGQYCDIGAQIIYELERHPDVEFVPEK